MIISHSNAVLHDFRHTPLMERIIALCARTRELNRQMYFVYFGLCLKLFAGKIILKLHTHSDSFRYAKKSKVGSVRSFGALSVGKTL